MLYVQSLFLNNKKHQCLLNSQLWHVIENRIKTFKFRNFTAGNKDSKTCVSQSHRQKSKGSKAPYSYDRPATDDINNYICHSFSKQIDMFYGKGRCFNDDARLSLRLAYYYRR